VRLRFVYASFRYLRASWYFVGKFSSWDDAVQWSTGYQDEKILGKVLEATKKVRSGEVAFERDSVTFNEIQYSWPVLSALMWAAAANRGCLKVLDFGGALGSSYYQNIKFFSELSSLKWNVVEQEHYVDCGNSFADPSLKFYKSIKGCLSQGAVDVALFSGVLDVIDDPYIYLKQIVDEGIKAVIIDRSAFLSEPYDLGVDEFVVQVVKPPIYGATLPFRHLSCIKLKQFLAGAGYTVVESFDSIGGRGDGWVFRGLIAKKNIEGRY